MTVGKGHNDPLIIRGETAPPSIDRLAWTAVTAHGIAERRGFASGHELEDWLEAETQVQFEILSEGRTF